MVVQKGPIRGCSGPQKGSHVGQNCFPQKRLRTAWNATKQTAMRGYLFLGRGMGTRVVERGWRCFTKQTVCHCPLGSHRPGACLLCTPFALLLLWPSAPPPAPSCKVRGYWGVAVHRGWWVQALVCARGQSGSTTSALAPTGSQFVILLSGSCVRGKGRRESPARAGGRIRGLGERTGFQRSEPLPFPVEWNISYTGLPVLLVCFSGQLFPSRQGTASQTTVRPCVSSNLAGLVW